MKRLKKWTTFFSLDYAIPLAIFFSILRVFNTIPLIMNYVELGFQLSNNITIASYRAVSGVGLILLDIILFTSALMFNAILLSHPKNNK